MAYEIVLLGIPVRIQVWFFLTAFLIGPRSAPPTQVVIWMIVVFAGVLVHELGHAFAGRAFGFEPAIELHGFGGLTSWQRSVRITPARDILISAAGPAVGIVIGSLALVASRSTRPPAGSPLAFLLADLVWVNLGWAILNLLPILPLDGGRIAASFAERLFGAKGRRGARVFSFGLTVVLGLWALSSGEIWLTIITVFLAITNWQALQAERPAARRRPPAGAPLQGLERLAQAYNRGEWDDVAAASQELLHDADSDDLRAHALYYLAWARLARGQVAEARQALDAMPTGMSPDPALAGSVLAQEGRWEEALPFLEQSLSHSRDAAVEARWRQAVAATSSFADADEFLASTAGRTVSGSTIATLERNATQTGDHAAAAALGRRLFKLQKDPETAFRVACSLARGGDTQGAVDWLQRAINAGFRDLERLDTEPALVVLRSVSGFTELQRRLGST